MNWNYFQSAVNLLWNCSGIFKNRLWSSEINSNEVISIENSWRRFSSQIRGRWMPHLRCPKRSKVILSRPFFIEAKMAALINLICYRCLIAPLINSSSVEIFSIHQQCLAFGDAGRFLGQLHWNCTGTALVIHLKDGVFIADWNQRSLLWNWAGTAIKLHWNCPEITLETYWSHSFKLIEMTTGTALKWHWNFIDSGEFKVNCSGTARFSHWKVIWK